VNRAGFGGGSHPYDFTYVATWRGFDDVEYATLE